jgi:hypothetical protein
LKPSTITTGPKAFFNPVTLSTDARFAMRAILLPPAKLERIESRSGWKEPRPPAGRSG